MNAMTHGAALSASDRTAITFVALLGMALLFLTGFGGASVLHDAAHDVRHSIGFPCH